jgi:heat shock protein HtpX
VNSVRLYLLFAVITLLLVIPGAVLFGFYGTLVGLALAAVALALLYFRSDTQIMKQFDGCRITDTSSWLYRLVAEVTKKARLDAVPEVYLIPIKAPNSFIVGRNARRAKLGLTEGLLETLTKGELEGVIGHELAHIRVSHAILSGIVTGVVTFLLRLTLTRKNQSGYRASRAFDSESQTQTGISHALLSLLIMPVAGAFVQLAITRNREFIADRRGATFTNRFQDLASALQKIQRSSERISSDNHPQLAHLLIYSSFHRPLLSALFSAHPPVSERVAQLEKLASTGGGVEGVF